LGPDKIQLFSVPADEISGDIVFSVQKENSSKQYFILADATGHGLTAAISLIPLSQLFYRLSNENCSLSDLVSALNARLFSILPSDRFVAATIGIIDEEKSTIEVWNGANPAPNVVNNKGEILHSFEKDNFCLGVVSSDIFSADPVTIHYDEPCELLAYSDGIIDAKDCQGNDFGSKGIFKSLTSHIDNEQSVFDHLIDDLNQFRDHENKVDDICVLSIKCS